MMKGLWARRAVILVCLTMLLCCGCAGRKGTEPTSPAPDDTGDTPELVPVDGNYTRQAQDDLPELTALAFRTYDVTYPKGNPEDPNDDDCYWWPEDAPYLRKHCDGPVMDREQISPDTDLVENQRRTPIFAAIYCPHVYVEETPWGCDFKEPPESEWPDHWDVTLYSPTDEPPPDEAITVRLEPYYLPCVSDPTHTEMYNEFKCKFPDLDWKHKWKYIFYRGRPIIADNVQTGTGPPPHNHLYLYVSSKDHLIDEYPGNLDWNDYDDYSIAFAWEPQELGILREFKDHGGPERCEFGGLRGYFDFEGCDGEDHQYNFKPNILEIGQETIYAEGSGIRVSLSVQSRPDVMFLMAHSYPHYVTYSDPPIIDHWQFRFKWIPNYDEYWVITNDDTITPYEINGATNHWSDTEWFVSLSAGYLHIGPYEEVNQQIMNGYDDWRHRVIQWNYSSLKAACGFRKDVWKGAFNALLLERFVENLDSALEVYPNPPTGLPWFDENHWENGGYSNDPAICAFMEAAYITDGYGEMVYPSEFFRYVTATSNTHTWVFVDKGDEMNHDWKISSDISPIKHTW